MNIFLILEGLVLPLLKGVIAAATTAKAPQEIIDAVQAAIDSLAKVRTTPVTRDQLESLKVQIPW